MANRIKVYGRVGESNTKRIEKQLRSMSLNYDFYDVHKKPELIAALAEQGADDKFPKVEITCAHAPGSVFASNPDTDALSSMLYAEEVLGVTSYWV